MARKKKRNGYAIFMCAYIVIVLVLIGVGLTWLWGYAEAYEASQPTSTMDEVVAELNKTFWNDDMAATIAAMPHEAQTDDECAEIIKSMIGSGVSYKRSGSTDTTITYNLVCDTGVFGSVTLREDTSVDTKYKGLYPWKLESESFDFTGLYSSVEVTIPKSFSVSVNGYTLGDEYITEDNIHYDILEDYYEDYKGLPVKATYKFDNIIGIIEPVITDANGNEFTIDPDKDDSQFLVPCSDAETSALDGFVQRFAERYEGYKSGTIDPTAGMNRLSGYLQSGSELYNRLELMKDGLEWSHVTNYQLLSVTLNSVISFGGGNYLCDFTTHITSDSPTGHHDDTLNYKIIVEDISGNLSDMRVVSLDSY